MPEILQIIAPFNTIVGVSRQYVKIDLVDITESAEKEPIYLEQITCQNLLLFRAGTMRLPVVPDAKKRDNGSSMLLYAASATGASL